MSPFAWRSLTVLVLLATPSANERSSGGSGSGGGGRAPAPAAAAPEDRGHLGHLAKETGRFAPTWKSLAQYQVPDWFRDAKFGIWAHWGPQCQPEQGDWYARQIYQEGSDANRWHVAHRGPPSRFGFKDVIHEWKAESWDPAKLLALYKRAGAQYFFALANHHDNFDLWDSRFQAARDVRFTSKGGAVYAIALGLSAEDLTIRALGTGAKLLDRRIAVVTLLGSDERISWSQSAAALVIAPPRRQPCEHALVFKITLG